MYDIPVFDPDTLSHAPPDDLINLLVDACVARDEAAGPRFAQRFWRAHGIEGTTT